MAAVHTIVLSEHEDPAQHTEPQCRADGIVADEVLTLEVGGRDVLFSGRGHFLFLVLDAQLSYCDGSSAKGWWWWWEYVIGSGVLLGVAFCWGINSGYQLASDESSMLSSVNGKVGQGYRRTCVCLELPAFPRRRDERLFFPFFYFFFVSLLFPLPRPQRSLAARSGILASICSVPIVLCLHLLPSSYL